MDAIPDTIPESGICFPGDGDCSNKSKKSIPKIHHDQQNDYHYSTAKHQITQCPSTLNSASFCIIPKQLTLLADKVTKTTKPRGYRHVARLRGILLATISTCPTITAQGKTLFLLFLVTIPPNVSIVTFHSKASINFIKHSLCSDKLN